MTETKKREAADYSESAVSLTNPPEVKELIDHINTSRAAFQGIRADIEKAIPVELAMQRDEQSLNIIALTEELRAAVHEHGGYQDRETQTYALIQKKRTAIYNVGPFKALAQYAKFVPLVVKEAIDPDALKGQIKGKLLATKQLEYDEVITYRTTESFILILPEVKVE